MITQWTIVTARACAVCTAFVLVCGCHREPTVSNGETNSVSAPTENTNRWSGTLDATANAVASTKEAGSNAWEKTKEALGASPSTNYFAFDYSKKNDFVAEAQASIDDLNKKTSSLSQRISSASESTKTNLQDTVNHLNEYQGQLAKRYDDVKNATPSNWDDAKSGFIKAYYDLKATLKAGEDSVTAKL